MDISSRGAGMGRSFREEVNTGTITIQKGTSKIEYKIRDSKVAGYTDFDHNKKRVEVVYGSHRKVWKDGKIVKREKYREGSNCARVFKGEWKRQPIVFNDVEATRIDYCYGGSYRKEIVKYANRKVAYEVSRYSKKPFEVFYPNGKQMFRGTGEVEFAWREQILPADKTDTVSICWRGSLHLINKDFEYDELFTGKRDYEITLWDREGKVIAEGKVVKRQKVDKWIEDYKDVYYLTGVQVSKRLYESEGEDLVGTEVLAIPNAQLKASLINKMTLERLIKDVKGKVVHIDGEYELIELPVAPAKIQFGTSDEVMRILKVVCPSTNAYYCLRVPPQLNTCEEARQWTFGAEVETERQEGAETTATIPTKNYVEFDVET